MYFIGSRHPAEFSGRGHFGNGDTLVLVCHMTSQDHVTKGSCDLGHEGSPSW